jgi:hypothetical protein
LAESGYQIRRGRATRASAAVCAGLAQLSEMRADETLAPSSSSSGAPTASTLELKARWAFGEMSSLRWAAKYRALGSDKIRGGLRFEELNDEERTYLSWMAMGARPFLVAALDRHQNYQRQFWTKGRLAQVYTIPRMAPDRQSNIPFLSFLACPRFAEDEDPRAQADRIPFATPFEQKEPVIVLPYDEKCILVEGYLRSVLFMRGDDPDARLAVWFPVV